MAKNTKSSKRSVASEENQSSLYYCVKCGKHYKKQDGNFPASQSELYAGNNYKLPICRNCLDELYTFYCEKLGDEDKALRRVCMKFDIYFNQSLADASNKITKNRSRIHSYISRANLRQYKDKTYDTTIEEEQTGVIKSEEHLNELKEDGKVSISNATIERWGIGCFSDADYKVLDDHYKMLKRQNPNCDNNQEIFIKDLCYIKLQQLKAMRNNNIDDFDKLTKLYRDTFKQAGLKTVQETDSSNEETLGVTLATISQYTPEEYYRDKKLYKDFENLGEYISRFVFRPLKNLMTGSKDRDSEYCVKDGDDYDQ